MFCNKTVRGPQLAAGAVLLAAVFLAGACSLDFSFELPEKLEITGSPTFTASAEGESIRKDPLILDDFFTIGDIRKAIEDGDSDAQVFKYVKTGNNQPLTYLLYYPVDMDEPIDEEQEIPVPEIDPVEIEIPAIEITPVTVEIPLEVPQAVIDIMKDTFSITPAGGNQLTIGEFIALIEAVEAAQNSPYLPPEMEAKIKELETYGIATNEWTVTLDPPLEEKLDLGGDLDTSFSATIFGKDSDPNDSYIEFAVSGIPDIMNFSNLKMVLTSGSGQQQEQVLDVETGSTNKIKLDNTTIYFDSGISIGDDPVENTVTISVEKLKDNKNALKDLDALEVTVTPAIKGLSQASIKYDIGEDKSFSEKLGDLSKIDFIALKKAGISLNLEAFIDNDANGSFDKGAGTSGDYPVKLDGLTLALEVPLLGIDTNQSITWEDLDEANRRGGGGKATFTALGDNILPDDADYGDYKVKIVPKNHLGDPNANPPEDPEQTYIKVNASAASGGSDIWTVTASPYVPVSNTPKKLIMLLEPSLDIDWAGAKVRGFYDLTGDIDDLTEDLENSLQDDIERISIDSLTARLYLPGSDISVDTDNLAGTDHIERKDMLTGATINLRAEYTTTPSGGTESDDILTNKTFGSPMNGDIGWFNEFLANNSLTASSEEIPGNLSLPDPRLTLDAEAANKLVHIINKKPDSLNLVYTIMLADPLEPGTGDMDNAVIINIPQPELLLEVPMKLRLEKKQTPAAGDPSGYAVFNINTFLDEYLPDWQEMLEVKEDGKTLRQQIEDQGVKNLSAKVSVSASYTNTITSTAEAWVRLWEKTGNQTLEEIKDSGAQPRINWQRFAVKNGAATSSSFSFDAGLDDLDKNYLAEVELRLPLVQGQTYGILEVKQGGEFKLNQVSATVAANVTIEKDLPWSKK